MRKLKETNALAKIFRRTILPMLAMMFAASPLCAQNGGLDREVTLSGTHITLGKTMAEIQDQTPYRFAFNPDQIDTGAAVVLPQNAMTIRAVLDLLAGTGKYKYVVRDHFIAISSENQSVERANVVARQRDNATYEYIIDDLNDNNPRPVEYAEYEIERTVTMIPDTTVVREYPQSHSATRGIVDRLDRMSGKLPAVALKTNLLYAASALTPNLSLEIGTKPRQSVELSGSYSWRGRNAAASDNHKQSAHWIARGEYRWWLCERFSGHYFGAHALYGRYYISGHEVPLMFEKEYSYHGWAAGAGATYGYSVPLGKQWNLEFNVGVGYMYMKYDRGTCVKCDPQPEKKDKHYFGPTRAGINLVFTIK